jgi:predicted MFS family arabinose efflux permease
MTPEAKTTDSAGIWATISESPRAAKVILLGVLINRLTGFLNIFLVLFLYAEGHGAGRTAIAVGLYGAGSVISYLIGGTLTASLGTRNLTLISVVCSAALIFGLLTVTDFGAILVMVILAGMASQVYWPASVTMLTDLTPDDRQVMIQAMYRFAVNVGSAAAPLLGFALYHLDHQRYTYVFATQALLGLVYGAVVAVTLPRRDRPEPATAADGVRPGARLGASYVAVLRDSRFVMFLVSVFLAFGVYTQYLSTLPLDIAASGLPVFWYSLAVSLNGIVVILFELPLTKVAQRLPIKPVVLVAFALVGIGMATYGLPLAPAVIVVGTLLWTAGEMIGGPRVFSYPVVVAPPALKPYYISAFQFTFGLSNAAGQAAGVALFAALGHGVWPVLALGSVLAMVFAAVALRRQHAPS